MLALPASLAAQCAETDTLDHWITHQIPPPAEGDVFYYLCDVVDEQTIWGLDGLGQFCRSTDGGCIWTTGKVMDPLNFDLVFFSLTATGAEEAWAVFYDNNLAVGRILHTTDGGLTWADPFPEGAFSLPNGFADMFHFFDDLNGVAIGDVTDGYFEIYTTADGGTTWGRVPSANIPLPIGDELYFLADNYAAVGNTIWSSSLSGRCFKSEDMGLTWTASEIFPPVPGNNFVTGMIAFRDEQHGLLGTYEGIFSTEDGGDTWQQVETEIVALNTFTLRSVPGTSNYLTGGAYPETYLTNDDGVTWRTFGTYHNEPEFLSPSYGWAASTIAPNSMLEWRGKTILGSIDRLHFAQVTVKQAAAIGQLTGSLIDFASGGSDVEVDWKVLRDGIQVATETDEVALPAGGSADVDFSYLPVATGEHIFASTASIAGGDVIFQEENNLLVTDSTVSKAGNSSDIPDYGFGPNFNYGPEFELPEPDTLTSLEVFFTGSFLGGPVDCSIRFFVHEIPEGGTEPGQQLYTSPLLNLTDANVNQWAQTYLAEGLPLAAGRYVFNFRVVFSGGDARSFGADSMHGDGTVWFNDGSGWFSFENPDNALLIRANFNPAGLPVAAQTIENEAFAHVFPNPATSSLTVEGQAKTASPLRLEVFDAFGRLNQTFEMNTGANGHFRQSLDVSGLPAGTLLVRITDREKSWSARVAKQ